MQAPFPYCGGKSMVADVIWRALGQPKHYIEPCFGSGAVLLARQGYDPTVHVETVCDADGFVANVWRALQADPDEVARWCDWPVNHADLSARKYRLLANEARLLENLAADETWYDARLAGYWVWAASCWIGCGLTSLGQIPHIGKSGKGVHKLGQIPHVGEAGSGVHKLGQIPFVSEAGKGVYRLSQRLEPDGAERDVRESYNTNLYVWFRALSERLRYVRVVCGDWTRVCGGDWQDKMPPVGIFFDPPYGTETRDPGIYAVESLTVAQDVERWALVRGDRPTYRIVVAGYDDEHAALDAAGWRRHTWSAQGGYANTGGGDTAGMANRHRECLWFSPHCLDRDGPVQLGMFEDTLAEFD